MLAFAHHFTRGLTIAVSIFLVTVLLIPSLAENGPNILVSLHGPLMVLAFVLFISMGMAAYVSDYGPKLNRRFPDRGSRRLLHGGLQMAGGLLALIAYLIHFTYTQSTAGSHIATGGTTWQKAHVWLGSIALVGVFIQACVGFYKFVVRQRDRVAIMKWHGSLGLLVWISGLANVCIAVYGTFFGSQTWVAVVAWIGIAGIAISTVVLVFLDPNRPAAIAADGDGGAGGYSRYEDETFMGSLYDHAGHAGAGEYMPAAARGSLGSLNGRSLHA